MTNQANNAIIEETVGLCHICRKDGRFTPKPIEYCGVCKHWFCAACRKEWWPRAWAALEEKIGGREPNCCGVGV